MGKISDAMFAEQNALGARPRVNSRRASTLLLVTCILLSASCRTSDYQPCESDGVIEGGVKYINGAFYDPRGGLYAFAGDRPFEGCTVVTGQIYIHGEIEHFEDFDNIEEIAGFRRGDVFLPAARTVDAPFNAASCGLIKGFPNLKRITFKQMDTAGFDVEGNGGCIWYDGFDSLEFVNGDFVCSGPSSLGSSLVEVTERLSCSLALPKLERVGEFSMTGKPLPNLKWAGLLGLPAFTYDGVTTVLELPSLVEIGPYVQDHENRGGLGIGLPQLHEFYAPQLERVDGFFTVGALGGLEPQPEGRGEEIRARFSSVEVTGKRLICHNDSTDPCPYDDECAEIYGVDSILCCDLDWPECLALYPENDGGSP